MSIMKTSISFSDKIGLPKKLLLQILLLGVICSIQFSPIFAQPIPNCSGLMDNYVCTEEPVSPDPALANMLFGQNAGNPCFGQLEFDNFPGQTKCDGTDIPANALFIHQLTFPVSGNVTSAIFQFRAKAAPASPPGAGQSSTDFIAFFEGATYITGANLIQLPEAGGTWNPSQDANFTLNLGNLPTVFPINNILQYLNDGDLDIVIGNETGVDWMCINPSTASLCCTDSLLFLQKVAQGFTIVTDSALCKATVTAPQFDSCHWFSTPPHLQGDNVPQIITATDGMWMFNFTQSGTYTICVNVYEQNGDNVCWQKEMCTTFNLACAPPPISTRYEVADKRCKYTLIPPKARWLISMKSVDSGGRDSVSSTLYHLQTAILKPTAFPAPNVSFTDSLGNPVLTAVGEEIILAENNSVADKIQAISPAPPGYGWYGLQSNLLTPSASSDPDSVAFDIAFEWSDLPAGSQDSTGAFWMSDDKDDLYQELITDAFTLLDTSVFRAATQYGIEVKDCKYTSDPWSASWKVYFKCNDSGGRISASSNPYHLQTAVLKPAIFPAPSVTLTDSLGNLVVTAVGEEVILAVNTNVAAKIQAISPAPPGYEWFGLQSNSLTPSESPNPDSQDFKIVFEWTGLPLGSQDSTGAFWVSDDKDDLYDEFIFDAYTLLEAAQLSSQKEFGKISAIRLFPNPTSGGLTLEFMGKTPAEGEVEILDLLGRTFHTETLLPGQQQHQLSMDAMPAGVYFVKVMDGGEPVWVEKVVKQ